MRDRLDNSLRRKLKVPWPPAAKQASPRYFVEAPAIVSVLLLLAGPAFANSSESLRGSRPELKVARLAAEVQVLAVRALSQVDSSQVFIDLSAEVRYKVGHLSNPERVYLDLPQTEVNPRVTSRR